MKRIFFTLLLLFSVLCGAKAMDYEEARDRAWFLTDKMAYELNLTPDQCERAYQINLDYLMSVRTASDCVGEYWRFRDVDLRCILFDWQLTTSSVLCAGMRLVGITLCLITIAMAITISIDQQCM